MQPEELRMKVTDFYSGWPKALCRTQMCSGRCVRENRWSAAELCCIVHAEMGFGWRRLRHLYRWALGPAMGIPCMIPANMSHKLFSPTRSLIRGSPYCHLAPEGGVVIALQIMSLTSAKHWNRVTAHLKVHRWKSLQKLQKLQNHGQ